MDMDYLWIDIIVSAIITGASYVAPIAILRYAIIKKPLEKPVAVIISIFIILSIWLLWRLAFGFDGYDYGPAIFWGIICTGILSSGEDRTTKIESEVVSETKNQADAEQMPIVWAKQPELNLDKTVNVGFRAVEPDKHNKDSIKESSSQAMRENMLLGKIKNMPFQQYTIKKAVPVLLILTLFIASNFAIYTIAYNSGSKDTIKEYSRILMENKIRAENDIQKILDRQVVSAKNLESQNISRNPNYLNNLFNEPDFGAQIQARIISILEDSEAEMIEKLDAK